tara:strand:- start:13 stop:669 length:657 start_codon:yes stop_codon:yes gene_type:complete
MKKILGTIFAILFIFIFNKTIISQIIIFSASKITERKISVDSIDINYAKNQIILNAVEVANINKLYYKNIFEAEKIMIQYSFRSLFSDLIIIDYLSFFNSKLFLEFNINTSTNIIINDNLGEVKKLDTNYKPKIYPTKKNDINFIILKAQINDSLVFIKTSNKTKEIKINLSNMTFRKIGNKSGLLHYKKVFRFILGDLFFKIPNKNLRLLIKKTYNF